MTLARLLAAALLICSLPALTQDQQPGEHSVISETYVGTVVGSVIPPISDFRAVGSIPASEPWRIMPNQLADLGSGQNVLDVLDPMRLDHYRLDQIKSDPRILDFK